MTNNTEMVVAVSDLGLSDVTLEALELIDGNEIDYDADGDGEDIRDDYLDALGEALEEYRVRASDDEQAIWGIDEHGRCADEYVALCDASSCLRTYLRRRDIG